MARKEIGIALDRENRNNHNDNFKELFDKINDVVGSITDDIIEEIIGDVLDHSKLNWKEAVETEADLPSDAETGDVHFVRENGKVYRWDGQDWIEIQEIDITILEEVEHRLNDRVDGLQGNINDFQAQVNDEVNGISEELGNVSRVVVSDIEPEDADIWFEVVE